MKLWTSIVNSGLFLDLKNDSYLWTLYGLRILARLPACIALIALSPLKRKTLLLRRVPFLEIRSLGHESDESLD
jgi:hypothetical protein